LENMPSRKARTLAQYLADWLDAQDLTQRELADDLPGVTATRVSRWVQGQDIPSRRYRDPLAERLGISRDDLDRYCASRDSIAVARAELQTAELALKRARAALGSD
jgi:transcriptional regulator with XRE-family HTH domain